MCGGNINGKEKVKKKEGKERGGKEGGGKKKEGGRDGKTREKERRKEAKHKKAYLVHALHTKRRGWVWWYPIVSTATQEAEAGE